VVTSTGVAGRLVRVAGSATHVVVEPGPADAVPVVLTAGLGGAWYDWDPVVPLLVGSAPVLRFDRRSAGRNPRRCRRRWPARSSASGPC
jgi:pimeloyl-ACP methyl ester carboxylesterase